jgi:hypothetical protein
MATLNANTISFNDEDQKWIQIINAWKEMNQNIKATRNCLENMLTTTQNTEALLKKWVEIYGKAAQTKRLPSVFKD